MEDRRFLEDNTDDFDQMIFQCILCGNIYKFTTEDIINKVFEYGTYDKIDGSLEETVSKIIGKGCRKNNGKLHKFKVFRESLKYFG